MARRLRPDARVFASVSLVTALTAAGLDRFPLAAQPGPTDVAALLERVSSYVQAYYTRAQSLMVEETVVVQPVKGDLAPDGFARSLLYDLRFEWAPGQGDEKPRVQVVRELLRANHRPAKPKDEPKCLDPEPITPEPLEFLLPGHHDDYTFAFEEWLELFHVVQIDDRRAVDAKEAFGREFLFELADASTQKVLLLSGVEAEVISVRFDPINLLGFEEHDTSFRLDRQAHEMW